MGEWNREVCGYGEESIGWDGGVKEGYGVRVKGSSDGFSGIFMASGMRYTLYIYTICQFQCKDSFDIDIPTAITDSSPYTISQKTPSSHLMHH